MVSWGRGAVCKPGGQGLPGARPCQFLHFQHPELREMNVVEAAPSVSGIL